MNSNEQLINKFNEILQNSKNCVVNIVNDKLTLAVFSLLEKNLKNVKEINFIIRDTRSIPQNDEVVREFEINPNDTLFNAYDITEKNKLQYFEKAKSMYDFISKNVNVKKTTAACQIKGNILIVDDEFMIQGSSSLERSPKAIKSKVNSINFDTVINSTMDKTQITKATETFQRVWSSNEYTEDFKSELLKGLEYLYKEHSPEFLYYFTLNELFGSQLDYGVERFEQDNTNFKKTKIWDMLYDFQKDAVLSAIQKINKYNGCIIADSVGLGKTFEALAVIKYFELRQDNVLVLTPAKLYDNWNSFKGAYKDSLLDEVFNYKIMFHTDLSRYKGNSISGMDLSRFDWSKFDLLVIDESHNFRNRTEKDFGLTRYQRLLEEVIKKNQNTKVLLLSATPVNNSLNDLKNQISIITADRDFAFEVQGIPSISNLLRKTSTSINNWEKSHNKSKDQLFDSLPSEFYKLLEMMTISRSRKHITNAYGTKEVGKFPTKLKPDTYTPHIDSELALLNFKDTNIKLEELILAVYMPMKYIKSQHKAYYREKYQTKYNNKIIFSHEDREFFTAKMHRFNLFKRLDSSVFAFGETIRRLKDRIDNYIKLLEQNADEIEAQDDDSEENDLSLDYKYEIKVNHLNKEDFLTDLYYDKLVLDEIYAEVEEVLNNKRDNKLHVLLDVVKNKVTTTPYNQDNKKVLIFTAFADTANYLYNELAKEFADMGITMAMVSGSGSPRANNKKVQLEFNNVLSMFSPRSKLKKQVAAEDQINVLIGTDCISEGQNLQDCDCVINYDIQWNPVSLIQRFGRIDRIGSINTQIKMINFFPDIALNEYLSLEKRVKSKMLATNIASTGDEDILSPEMNDIDFRKRQLERLKDEVIDIDEASDNISLTDLNMNEYLFELAEYIKKEPEIKKIPKGIYSVSDGDKQGVIFCFKHKNNTAKPDNDSSLYPYYLIYTNNEGDMILGNTQARDLLKHFRKLCYQKDVPVKEFFDIFFDRTNNVKDMSHYSQLLTKSIKTIQGYEETRSEQTVFDFGGFNNPFAGEEQDDFELVSFLVVE